MKLQRKYTARAIKPSLYGGERTTLMVAATLCMVAFSLYVYFLSVSIVNVVMRQEIDQEIRTANASLADLESRYIVARSRITEAEALERGFMKGGEKTFVSKNAENLVLSRNDES
ncbi:MAG: hypothetical protein RLZZ234_259 [Candidatus Parcubacteria bacterium]|jgi:hypothetical protein